jgi:FkbM family methyltransferase
VAIEYCRDFKVAVQAGGAQGVWPKELAKRFRTVYTFEPEPTNFQCLCHNCPEKNIIKMQAALGPNHSFPMELEFGKHGRRNMGAIKVSPAKDGPYPVINVDSLNLHACDFLQLDIEGMEPHAILGAQATIEECRPVIMVEDKGLSEEFGHLEGWAESWIPDMGYRLEKRLHRDIIFVPE